MSVSHAPAPKPEFPLPNEHFIPWLRHRADHFLSQFLAIVGFASLPLSTLYYASHFFEGKETFMKWNPRVLVIVDVAHIIVLTIFIVVLIGIRNDNSAGTYRTTAAYKSTFRQKLGDAVTTLQIKLGRRQLRRFKTYFLCFWIAMLGLYIAFCFKHSLEAASDPSSHTENTSILSGIDKIKIHASTKRTNANELTFDTAVEGLNPPASPERSAEKDKGIQSRSEAFYFMLFPFLTFALNNISMMFILWCFFLLFLPPNEKKTTNRHRRYIGFSTCFFVMLTCLYPLLVAFVYRPTLKTSDLQSFETAFDGVSGVLNAVVLALLIARLDSKLIGLPSILISVLYFYSAVQPLFAVFEQPIDIFKLMQTSVLIIVFGFKIYFFLIIVYALQTGRMLNYLICFPILARRMDSIWENQFVVTAKLDAHEKYVLALTRHSKPAYFSSDGFRKIEACDRQNEELRILMGERASYRLANETGTHWVRVVDSFGATLLQSTPLRSEEEAEELIEESICNVPFCKYDRG